MIHNYSNHIVSGRKDSKLLGVGSPENFWREAHFQMARGFSLWASIQTPTQPEGNMSMSSLC